MKNTSSLKNELIFEYASGKSSIAKSLLVSTYLFLNSKEVSSFNIYENYLGDILKNSDELKPEKLTYEDCISSSNTKIKNENINPINKLLNSLGALKWEKIFNGFYEYSLKLSNGENAKLIKMDKGAKVPLHSHNGKEYILVLDGSFCDEYGKYSKGNLQINDSNIKHTPIACDTNGCVCLTITEKELVFFGALSPLLNIITFFKTIFASSK